MLSSRKGVVQTKEIWLAARERLNLEKMTVTDNAESVQQVVSVINFCYGLNVRLLVSYDIRAV